MIRAALWTNHLSDLPQLADVQKSARPAKFNFLLLLFFFWQQPPVLLRPLSTYKLLFNCDTSDAVICRMKIPFPNSPFS